MMRDREKEKNVYTAKVIRDDFFATKKWFIVLGDGFKANTVGFKTKKSAVAAVEATGWTVVDEFLASDEWEAALEATGWTVVDEFEVK